MNSFNSYKSISQLVEEKLRIENSLKDHKLYWAHVSPRNSNNKRKPELLFEHIDLVLKKAVKLVEIHCLDRVIDKHIYDLLTKSGVSVSFGNELKLLWLSTILFHDHGKVNVNFQANSEKMNNPNFIDKVDNNSPLSTHHSALSAYIYLGHFFTEFSKVSAELKKLYSACCIAFSYPIFKHHSKFLSDNFQDRVGFSEGELKAMISYLGVFELNISQDIVQKVIPNVKKVTAGISDLFNNFSLYSLVKLNFSLLTASDFLASGEYMTDYVVNDFGVLTLQRKEQMHQHISGNQFLDKASIKTNYNRDTFSKAATQYHFINPKERSNINLNILRQEMGIEILQKIRKWSGERLFYIEAPTGGGKTNLSFLATIELLRLNPELNKVYYVFPFTTLVTQTEQALKEAFNLSSHEIITLSSKSGFKEKEGEDDQYGDQRGFYLDNLFSLFPVCLMTHIKFFNILKTNEKSENYLLHRLANSVVVIDELQAYDPKQWQKVIFFIQSYAELYNIRFIVMSATLPKLDELDIFKKQPLKFKYLIDDAKSRYFRNPNFSHRVKFDLDTLCGRKIELDEIADTLIEKSKAYSLTDWGEAKPEGSVYTIIEFIFKKTATAFYKAIEDKEAFFDEVFVLSGTILEHRRKYIINYLKNPANRKKKILLITTQVVEAGVDIDMDIGFKDTSLIDSDEQLAGRINRNVNKENCTLYLFEFNNQAFLYKGDKRWENTRNLGLVKHKEILETKDFDSIYNKVLKGINEWDNTSLAIGFGEYKSKINSLQFQSVHFDFQLIQNENQNISVFVPLEIPIQIAEVGDGQVIYTFSQSEQDFLIDNGIDLEEGIVSGKLVFELYLRLHHPGGDIMRKQIDFKKMQGIISRFIFQLIGTDKVKNQVAHFSDLEKRPFSAKPERDMNPRIYYLDRWENIYDPIFGLDDTRFSDITLTQFM